MTDALFDETTDRDPFPAHVFRAYDIRGKAYDELSPAFCQALGGAIADEVKRRGGHQVAVVRDCRLSSPALADALIEGLLSRGVDVADQGMGPTPLLYFAVIAGGFDAGVVVTGSHNPIADNGMKIVYAAGAAYGEEIQALRTAMCADAERMARAATDETTDGATDETPDEATYETPDGAIRAEARSSARNVGRGVRRSENRRDAYVAAVLRDIRPAVRRLVVSVDGGSGAAGPLAVRVLEAMGHTVVGHAITPDGRFPIHHPDPTTASSLAYMAACVVEDTSDLCVGLDGDGDRLGVVDDRGQVIMGDRLSALWMPEILRDHAGRTVLADVKCSQVLFDAIAANGGHAVMAQVGHSVMKAQMRATNAVFAGEVSGHFFFADRWFGFDDGIYAAARMVEWLSQVDGPLSAHDAALARPWSTPEVRVDCPDVLKFAVVTAVSAALANETACVTIDGVRAVWPDGWGLVRASNTQAVLVLRAEAKTEERCHAIFDQMMNLVHKVRTRLADPDT